jgi:hypothetical protein
MTLSGFQIQGPCEWCGKEALDLRPIRNWEEHGSFSPRVYLVCGECAGKEREGFEAAAEEWAAYVEKHYVEQQQ